MGIWQIDLHAGNFIKCKNLGIYKMIDFGFAFKLEN